MDEPLRAGVRRVRDGPAGDVQREDLGRRIARVETGQSPRVPFADQQHARDALSQRQCVFDRPDRQHARGARGHRVRRHGERAEDVDHQRDAARLRGAGDVVDDLELHGRRRACAFNATTFARGMKLNSVDVAQV